MSDKKVNESQMLRRNAIQKCLSLFSTHLLLPVVTIKLSIDDKQFIFRFGSIKGVVKYIQLCCLIHLVILKYWRQLFFVRIDAVDMLTNTSVGYS